MLPLCPVDSIEHLCYHDGMSEYPLVSKSGKAYREVIEGDKVLHEYQTGTVLDGVTKKMVRGATKQLFTRETQANFTVQRMARKRELIDKAMPDSVQLKIWKAAVQTAQGNDHAALKAVELLMTHGGYTAPATSQTQINVFSDDFIGEAIKRLG